MDLKFFLDNLTKPNDLVPKIHEEHCSHFNLKDFRELDPKFHKVNNRASRPDKEIQLERINADQTKTPYTELVPVTRIALPYQEYLTATANAFLTGGKVKIIADAETDAEKATLKKLLEIWKDEKLAFKNSQIGQAIYSETEAVEIWYTKVTGEGNKKEYELKCNIYTPSMGYKLIPIYDEYTSLLAFARQYTTKRDGVEVAHLDVYTKDAIWRYEQKDGDRIGWQIVPFKEATDEMPLVSEMKIPYGKIPVVFYQINKPIWKNVQSSIERLEISKSNHSDQNDYTGSPILAASGTIKGFSTKGQTGKVVELEGGADLKYITADGAPDSVKMEQEGLKDDIHTLTQTPNLSFSELSKISGQLSAPIMDRMLTGSHLKAKQMQQGAYGEGIQRRINFLITAISNIFPDCKGGQTLRAEAEFDLFRIGENTEIVDVIMKMSGNAQILSTEEAIKLNPYSENPTETMEKIKEEQTEKAKVEAAKVEKAAKEKEPETEEEE